MKKKRTFTDSQRIEARKALMEFKRSKDKRYKKKLLRKRVFQYFTTDRLTVLLKMVEKEMEDEVRRKNARRNAVLTAKHKDEVIEALQATTGDVQEQKRKAELEAKEKEEKLQALKAAVKMAEEQKRKAELEAKEKEEMLKETTTDVEKKQRHISLLIKTMTEREEHINQMRIRYERENDGKVELQKELAAYRQKYVEVVSTMKEQDQGKNAVLRDVVIKYNSYQMATLVEGEIKDLARQMRKATIKDLTMHKIVKDMLLRHFEFTTKRNFRKYFDEWYAMRCQLTHEPGYVDRMDHSAFDKLSKDLRVLLDFLYTKLRYEKIPGVSVVDKESLINSLT
jgi:hypothetical protein